MPILLARSKNHWFCLNSAEQVCRFVRLAFSIGKSFVGCVLGSEEFDMSVPVFPLNAVLCPGGKMPLKVFEPRYLDIVKQSLKQNSAFLIVLLKSEEPTSGELPFYEQGTLARVVDFDLGEGGILLITVEGLEQVSIVSAEKSEGDVWDAEVEICTQASQGASNIPIPNQYLELTQVLKALVQHPTITELNLAIDFEDSQQVGWRLTELLPLENEQKQYLFELSDPLYRLEKISDQLSHLAS